MIHFGQQFTKNFQTQSTNNYKFNVVLRFSSENNWKFSYDFSSLKSLSEKKFSLAICSTNFFCEGKFLP